MESVLEIKGLTKKFGKITAVDNLNLTIKQGEVYGILGPNGSGKTTTLGMVLDVVSPTGGQYRWFDGLQPVKARQQIGAILETPCFYPYMTAAQNLQVTAHIKNCPKSRIDEVLKIVGLYERKDDKFKTYSLGMKQRLAIAAALLADPPLMILDEPTNGLDPQGIAEIRSLIRSIAKDGKTIIIASHLLDEVQKVCTHFCVLRKGVKLHEGSVAEILSDTNQVEVAAADLSKLMRITRDFKGTESQEEMPGYILVNLKEGFTADQLNKHCFEHNIALKRLLTRKNSLEQEFLKILEEK